MVLHFLSWVDKVTTRTWSFASVIAQVPAPAQLIITQFAGYAGMRLISQLIKGVLSDLQKLRKCFKDTAISKSFVLPSVGVFPVILIFDFDDSEFTVASSYVLSL